MQIDVIEPKLFASVIADEFIATINDFVSERGTCSIALSGGSTPGTIYRSMALPPRVGEVDWTKISIFWGDERWVPHTDNQSNYKMAKEAFLDDLPKPGPKIYPVDTSLKTPEDSAKDYENKIRDALNTKDGTPTFDLMVLGMGEDGHTASLFPSSPVLRNNKRLCHAVVHPTDGSQRVTMSSDLIFSSRRIAFIVKGDSKADIVKRVIEGSDEPEVIPARLYVPASDRVTWFVDSQAAKRLER